MISLRRSGVQAASRRRRPWWSFVAAVALTGGAFSVVLLSMRVVARMSGVRTHASRALPERIVLVVPRPPERRDDLTPAIARERLVTATRAPRVAPSVTRDTGAGATRTTPAVAAPSALPSGPALSPDVGARLAPPLPGLGAWSTVPGTRDPFAAAPPPTPAEVLATLSSMVPDLAARRVPTKAELDLGAKEATLKMRLSGRTLLVPPDNSGGLIVARVPLRRRKVRAPDARALDEGSVRLRRLRARADSARRAREDSVDRAAGPVP